MFSQIIEFLKNFFTAKGHPRKEEPTTTPEPEEEVLEGTDETEIIIETIDKKEKTEDMSKISKYVSMGEVTHSNTAISLGIDNTPTDEELVLIKELCVNVFDKLREHTGAPIKINSVYRGPKVNAEIGGSETSQHCVGLDASQRSYGAAIDIDDYYWRNGKNTFNNTEMGHWIRENLDYDQLIYEKPVMGYPGWIHVSYRPDGKNRKQNMIYTGGKYIPYEGNESMIVNPDLD